MVLVGVYNGAFCLLNGGGVLQLTGKVPEHYLRIDQ